MDSSPVLAAETAGERTYAQPTATCDEISHHNAQTCKHEQSTGLFKHIPLCLRT